jgi:hypothetical protein
LKIRVSVVRFRPWPPPFGTVVLLVETAVFSLWGWRFERHTHCCHFAATLLLLVTTTGSTERPQQASDGRCVELVSPGVAAGAEAAALAAGASLTSLWSSAPLGLCEVE